ncbi:superfamily II helicase [Indivirus ILV1]|uniref:Superfamily II helicase n=1 Tax=Indivirus ILV1 TaxID=1977633 RepID=A0A1V0SED5_9VIRU|nr:superfamily II helicase [Indivirus ILV1]
MNTVKKQNEKIVGDVLPAHQSNTRGPIPTITTEKIFQENTRFRVFNKTGCKDRCIEYLITQSNLYQFSEDINSDMIKRHYAIDRNSIYTLSQTRKFHLYEEYAKNQPVKLFLDIDLDEKKYPNGVKSSQEEFNRIVNECLSLVIKKLKDEYKIIDPSIIILDSTTENKYSHHLIFNNVVFPNCDAVKFFILCIDSHWIKDQILDTNVYKGSGSFRLLFNSKCGKSKTLEFLKGINYDYTNDKQLFMDSLVTNLPVKYHHVDIVIPIIEKVNKKIIPQKIRNIIDNTNSGIVTCSNDLVKVPVSTLKKYLDILNSSRADSYNTWISMAMCLHNCNPDQDCFDMFDEWSKQSDSYMSKGANVYFWNKFKFGHKSIGTLKHLAREDNPEKYAKIEFAVENESFESISFDEDYLLNDKEENIKDLKSFISKYICDWINDPNKKTLAIKSPYNTGKTKLIKKIIKEFNIQSILFGSYRQTLTHELYGNFKDDGVQSYLEGNFSCDKLICQVESLDKLLKSESFIDDNMEIPSYDMVILDEIEGILAHFRSTTLHEKERIFNLLKDIIYNSKKLFVLDGDFHNRSYDFIKYFGESTILKNVRKKNKKHFIFTSNREYFEDHYSQSVKNKKNINLVSMSSNLATYFYDKYKDKRKCMLHCSKSDDEYKKELMKVEEFWKLYEMVIYSPTIEAGVSFDTNHFDTMYIILSSDSTCQRGLMQMTSRIRRFTDMNVVVYLNGLPFKENANFFTYDEILLYIMDIYNKYLPYTVYTNENNKRCVGYVFDLYSQILVHNEKENANKTKNLFVPYLLNLMKDKGHTYEYLDDKRYTKNSQPYEKETIMKDEILKANNIDNDEYNHLLSNQRNNIATREDKIQIERYLFMKEWGIVELNEEFLDKYYGKTYILNNLRCLIGNKKLNAHIINDEMKDIVEYDKARKIEQIVMIKEVLHPFRNSLRLLTDQKVTVVGECKVWFWSL